MQEQSGKRGGSGSQVEKSRQAEGQSGSGRPRAAPWRRGLLERAGGGFLSNQVPRLTHGKLV